MPNQRDLRVKSSPDQDFAPTPPDKKQEWSLQPSFWLFRAPSVAENTDRLAEAKTTGHKPIKGGHQLVDGSMSAEVSALTAQASVETGTMLVVGTHMTQATNDKQQIEIALNTLKAFVIKRLMLLRNTIISQVAMR
ncbi:MAG: hypothetical protein ACPGF7_05330 [Pontibacterium sp.]